MRSTHEIGVCLWLESLGYEVEPNNRTIIKSPKGTALEIDVYLPKYRYAIEVDGQRYHQERKGLTYNKWELIQRSPKVSNEDKLYLWEGYHRWKDTQCSNKGVKLIHITDLQWQYDQAKTKEYILKELEEWLSLTCAQDNLSETLDK